MTLEDLLALKKRLVGAWGAEFNARMSADPEAKETLRAAERESAQIETEVVEELRKAAGE